MRGLKAAGRRLYHPELLLELTSAFFSPLHALCAAQVVRVAWSRRHVQVWAKESMAFSDVDVEVLAPLRGRALAEAGSAPPGMSPAAAAALMGAVRSGDWSLRQAHRRGPPLAVT